MEIVLTVVALGFIWWLLAFGRGRQAAEAAKKEQDTACGLAEAACLFISKANADRHFPEVEPGNVNVKRGEFVLLREPATLFEQKSHRVGSGIGTRVKVGKMPFYLGSTGSTSYETTEPIDSGDLVLTNTRLVFMSGTRSATIALKDAVGIEANLGRIIVHFAKRKTPYVFGVANPVLWSLLAKIGASHPLESRFLPDGVTLKATAGASPGEVHFETSRGEASAQLQ